MQCKKILLAILLAVPTLSVGKELLWYDGGHVAYQVQKDYGTVVEKALDMFEGDMLAVTGKRATREAAAPIAIYQLDRANKKELKALRRLDVPYEKLAGKMDAFWLGVRQGKVVVVGANGRGTAYGILELSRMAGVSPWIYWGDVVPERRERLAIDDEFETLQAPSVEYRGVFINDEDWTNRIWNARTLDPGKPESVMAPRYYHKLFELLLRLRGNALWPAMHTGTTAFFKVEGNKEVADSFDIAVGSSHCEPILRNNVDEWNHDKLGDFNWMTNRKAVESYWRERAKETAGMDALYTIGMRGIHDGAMEGVKTAKEKLDGLQSVIDFQRQLLSEEVCADVTKVPQVFVPYKEVLQIYESGLQVPDDGTLMGCDDNYGYMTRLGDAEQQRRSGGSGVYYHLSYWGRPHDYMWLTTMQPGLLYNEMRQAYDHNARRLWIVNVHDPKVAAYDLSLFMDMAWNIDAMQPNTLRKHLQDWLSEQFGQEAGDRLVGPMTEFYRLCGIRHPEFMGWNQVELDKKKYARGWSPVQDTEFSSTAFGNELERYLADYERLKQQINAVERTLRPELRDAFFATIKSPVSGAAAMATKMLQAQEARRIAAERGDSLDNDAMACAVRSWKAYKEIDSLTQHHNKVMANGKWDGNMHMAPRDLYVFQAPNLPSEPTAEQIDKYSDARPAASPLQADDAIVRNACDYSSASEGTHTVEMLGHSMKAVALPKGGEANYTFQSKEGDATLFLALIPMQAMNKGAIRFSVSIDGDTPTVYTLKEKYRSEQWKLNVLRGQALRKMAVKLAGGEHTLTIKALDDHIVLDQWMIGYDMPAQWYVFPVKAAL